MLSHSQAAVFKGAVALALLHAFDDAIVHRGAGVDLSQHALGLLLCVAIGAASIAAFAKLRVGARSLLALGLGSAATANGVAHAMHVEAHGPSSGDFTGLVALAAGLTLVGLAAWMPWRHRGEGAPTRGRRIGVRVTGSLATAALLVFAAVPVGLGIAEIHKGRSPIPAAPDHSYAEVAFEATDGARIAGWYRPSANGASVIVLHGGGGDRTGTLAHAEMLARHGYGVLLYDARGRGESEGVANSYGWGWEKDAAGALDFVRAQPDVQDGRVGGLGLSSGADTMIDLAAHRRDLRAVVADGAAMRSPPARPRAFSCLNQDKSLCSSCITIRKRKHAHKFTHWCCPLGSKHRQLETENLEFELKTRLINMV
jgi:hypothetical protein